MKRISILMIAGALAVPSFTGAQDAATEERLNKISGQIEDIIARQTAQQKQLENLAREIETLREQMNKPRPDYAGQEDLKRLAKSVEEVDRKRMEDSERVAAQLAKLGKLLSSTPAAPPRKPSPAAGDNSPSEREPAKDEKGYWYVVQSGDTVSAIVQAYREKNIKITTDQIMKANPNLKPEKMKVGDKVWIPAPPS